MFLLLRMCTPDGMERPVHLEYTDDADFTTKWRAVSSKFHLLVPYSRIRTPTGVVRAISATMFGPEPVLCRSRWGVEFDLLSYYDNA